MPCIDVQLFQAYMLVSGYRQPQFFSSLRKWSKEWTRGKARWFNKLDNKEKNSFHKTWTNESNLDYQKTFTQNIISDKIILIEPKRRPHQLIIKKELDRFQWHIIPLANPDGWVEDGDKNKENYKVIVWFMAVRMFNDDFDNEDNDGRLQVWIYAQ